MALPKGDMIGRNGPDGGALLGRLSLHCDSAGLVEMALRATEKGPQFKLVTLRNRPEDVEG